MRPSACTAKSDTQLELVIVPNNRSSHVRAKPTLALVSLCGRKNEPKIKLVIVLSIQVADAGSEAQAGPPFVLCSKKKTQMELVVVGTLHSCSCERTLVSSRAAKDEPKRHRRPRAHDRWRARQ